jgi:hypothetical protein
MKSTSVIFSCLLFMFGCEFYPKEANHPNKNYLVNVDMTNNGGFSAVLPEGTSYNDLESFNDDMQPIYEQLIDEGTDIQFEFGENIRKQLDVDLANFVPSHADDSSDCNDDDGIQTTESPLSIGWGYNLTSGFGYKYVSGCIKKNVYRLAVRLNKDSSQAFDMHAAFYKNTNGKTCFGLYESVRGWTRCTCAPTYSEIKGWVVEVAVAAGITAGIATIVANIVTPLIFTMAI